VTFYLLDTDSANLIGSYPTIDDALRTVQHALRPEAKNNVHCWALESQNERDEISLIAEGDALVALAHRNAPAA
jgi:hypothetical protein